MAIREAVVDQVEFSWAGGVSLTLRGWKAVSGENPAEFLVTDGNGQTVMSSTILVPRPDVAQAYPEYRDQESTLGFSVTVPLPDSCLETEGMGLSFVLKQGQEQRTLKTFTGEELMENCRENTISFKLDVLELSGKDILIRGWIVDVCGENFFSITDECGKTPGEGPRRVLRRDVTEAMKGAVSEDTPVGFVFSMQRKDFHGKKLILTMKNRYVTKSHEISMKEFDFDNSKRGKLQKVLGRNQWTKNRKILEEKGFFGFVDYVKDESRSEDERYMAWLKGQRPSKAELFRQKHEHFSYEPLISIVIPLYNTPQEYLRALLLSITAQTYGKFQLCLADGSTKKGPGAFVKKFYGKDQRICYRHLSVNGGISENTNAAIAMAKGDFLLFADHDDLLEPNALYELVKALNEDPTLDILYTDEDLTDAEGKRFYSPRFKPDFNPDFLRSINYICHIFMVRTALANQVGGLRKICDGAQDFDFILRCVEQTSRIRHISKVLYHWRAYEESTAGNQGSKQYAIDAGKLALEDHYRRMGYEAKVEYTGIFIMYRSIFQVQGLPLVSILIPNRDQSQVLENCVESIYKKTDYENFEIIIIENNSREPETFALYDKMKEEHGNLRVITYEGSFNYSAINNLGVKHAGGDYLLFLNNDTEVISPFWIREMLGLCQRSGTGLVGAKLYYPDDTVQHAGVVVGLGNFAGHVLTQKSRYDNGYFGRLAAIQDISAVTAACMLAKRSVFEAVGGFDEDFQVALNDVDLCLKVRSKGELVVLDPNVELYHYESKSRGFENTPEKQKRFKEEILRFRKKWKKVLDEGDPYYNPNLTLSTGECTLKRQGEVPEIWKILFPEGKER